jgi:cysteine desulfurase
MIYLDHNATTPVLPEVAATMEPYRREEWGNPSSSYRFGSRLKKMIETGREQVAELIGARAPEIVFTSGWTESDNTALHAMARAHPARRHLITSVVEHSAVPSYCRGLEEKGFRITYLPVDRERLLSLADLEAAVTAEIDGVSRSGRTTRAVSGAELTHAVIPSPSCDLNPGQPTLKPLIREPLVREL